MAAGGSKREHADVKISLHGDSQRAGHRTVPAARAGRGAKTAGDPGGQRGEFISGGLGGRKTQGIRFIGGGAQVLSKRSARFFAGGRKRIACSRSWAATGYNGLSVR